MHPKNIEVGELFGRNCGFKVCTGARYLGGYIGDDVTKGDYIKKRTEKWERDIHVIIKTTDKCPQDIYTALTREVQSGWFFMNT